MDAFPLGMGDAMRRLKGWTGELWLEPGTGMSGQVDANRLTEIGGTLIASVWDSDSEFLRATATGLYQKLDAGDVGERGADLRGGRGHRHRAHPPAGFLRPWRLRPRARE